MLAGRAETLHSGLLPQHMAAGAVAVGPVLLLLSQAVQVGASVLKVPRQAARQRTARAAVVTAARH